MKSDFDYFKLFLCMTIGLIVIATISLIFIEDISTLDSFYFAITTFTTVGLGDISPKTVSGKIFTIIFIIMSTVVYLGVIAYGTDILLTKREEKLKTEKLSMFLSVFFSELGNEMLSFFNLADPNRSKHTSIMAISANWQAQDYKKADLYIQETKFTVDITAIGISRLHKMLVDHTQLLLTIYETPYLIERHPFTSVLQSLFHLKSELNYRKDFNDLPDDDKVHLTGDINRVYSLIVPEWLIHVEQLQKKYPYLFSLMVRVNPFIAEKQNRVLF